MNMNEWIVHLRHPLVLVGFALFLFALVIKPLFLNSKKLSGPLIAPLLRWGMILLFLLAAMAMVGGFALSWKTTPAASSGISLSREQYAAEKQKDREVLIKEIRAAVGDEKKLQLLEIQLKAVEGQLADIQKSYEEEVQLRKTIEKELVQLKGTLPDAQIEEAIASLWTSNPEAAKQLLDAVEEQADKNAARAAYHSGRLAEGKLDYARAMQKYKKAVEREPDNPDYLLATGHMARTLGDYAQAHEWLERLLKMREAEGKDDVDLAQAVHEVADVYYFQGKYAEAESLYQRSLVIREQKLGKEHPDVAATLNNLALLYNAQEKYIEAEPLYRRSLEIYEKFLGKDHPDMAESLNNLATLYYVQGRYEEAEPLLKRSLEIKEKALGKDHPDVAESLNNLATLYYAQGRYEEAEPLFRRSLDSGEKVLGKEHPHMAVTLNNLAELYKAQGKHAEAEPLYQRTIAIMKAKFPGGHPNLDLVQKNYDELKRKMAGQ